MKKLYTSASKLVFLFLTVAACIGLFTNKISQDNFMILAISAFSFYFAKPPTPDTSITTTQKVEQKDGISV